MMMTTIIMMEFFLLLPKSQVAILQMMKWMMMLTLRSLALVKMNCNEGVDLKQVYIPLFASSIPVATEGVLVLNKLRHLQILERAIIAS